jgi:tetratricopeptide (TPR) repeat protein
MLLILQSGFLRWTGQYVDALNCLEEAMRLAFASSDWTNNVLEVLEQLCYLGIQKDDASILRRYVFHFYRQALLQHVHPRVGMALRFLAVLNIMEARYGTAEKLLDMSIRLFEKLETRGNVYTLSIIAAVQYKGDIALHQGDHKAAFDFYLRCVRLCDGKEFFKVQCLHLAKLAWCAARLWRLNDVKKYVYCAASYLDAAQNSLGAYAYGGEVIFALSALLKIKEGNFPQAALDLRKAIAISTIIQKPFWNALFFCLLALLKKHADHIVTKCLSGTSDYYWNESKRLFGFLCLDREVEAYAQLEQLLWEDKNCRDNN